MLIGNVVPEGTEGARDTWTYRLTNSQYNKTATENLYTRLRRSLLISAHRNYYFKTIKYTLNTIEANNLLYPSSSTGKLTTTGGGNFYGYIDNDSAVGAKYKTTLKLESDDEDIEAITKTSTATVTAGIKASYYVDTATFSKENIEAGDSVSLSGDIVAYSYVYGGASWLRRIIIGVILPEGISIPNAQAVTIKYVTGGQTISGIQLLPPQDLGNGTYLWKIKLPEDVYVGYWTESLAALSVGSKLNYTINLNTSVAMNSTVLNTKDMVLITGKNLTNSYASTITDKYDLNENGSKTDYIARISDSKNTTFRINPTLASIDINDRISITSNGNDLPAGDNNIYTSNDTVTYTTTVGCHSGGQIDNFEYYIPIPKKTSIKDNFLIRGESSSSFDFEMQNSAVLTGDELFNIYYCFEPGLTYNQAKEYSTWYTKEDIENDANLNFADVTMLKITMINDVIYNGDEESIAITMKYAGDNYAGETGMINKWSGGGEYNYFNNGRVMSGDMATEGCNIKLNYDVSDLDTGITLTAAKDRMPLDSGNVNQMTVGDTLPQFINSHTFTISNIETHNVTLKTKEYMQANIEMSSALANQTFGITIKLNDNSEYDLAKSTVIGTNPVNTIPSFTYELYNANALSDNLQERYVIVTLKSNNGLTIKQKININVEIAGVSEIAPAIIAGKNYAGTAQTDTSITITEDSCFTAQFASEYVPNMYTTQKIILNEALPVNTTIVLVNIRGDLAPTYWYYKVNSAVTEIDFTVFKQMGKTEEISYTKSNDDSIINEKFIIAVDFGECTSYMTRNTHTIKLQFTGENDAEFNSTVLNFVTTAKREFTFTTSAQETMVNTNFSVTYTLGSISGVETKYMGKKMTLVIEAPNTLPKDSTIVVGTDKYIMNSEKEFIIPLEELQTGTKSITMKLVSDMLPNNETEYDLNIGLWVSLTANEKQPKAGEKIAEKSLTIKTNKTINPALKVLEMGNRLVELSNVQDINNVRFYYKPDTGCTLKVELQKKSGNGYQKVTDVLSEFGGVSTHSAGVFNVSPIDGRNKMNFALAMTTNKGTYRLLFKVVDSNGNIILEVPYNLLVIE